GEELGLEILGPDNTICPGEIVQLEVTGCEDCSYSWVPAGSVDDPGIANPMAMPEETTTYTVTVAGRACTEDLSTTVTVECLECPINRLFMPSAFTPNGDGVNDFICLRSEDFDRFDEISLMYYNRWGQELYRKIWVSDPNDPTDKPDRDYFCWDGTFNGKVLPPDVYGYHIDVVCPSAANGEKERVRISGNFTLLQR
ncbi:MAG: gliding motility-associated C-terminal domain-containing protein, partial [Phaeodactylibacter sp.]|nr:gliding motility-associated C-terminal domain-containing protein [Phaeodactylibacter sp.]